MSAVTTVESRSWGSKYGSTRHRMICTCGKKMPWTTQSRAEHQKVIHQQAHQEGSE